MPSGVMYYAHLSSSCNPGHLIAPVGQVTCVVEHLLLQGEETRPKARQDGLFTCLRRAR